MNVFGERQHPEKFIPMVIQRARDGQKVFVHSNKEKTQAGSRHYIHAQDVADGLMFILKLKNYKHLGDFGNATCPKFNLVGPEEIDNLELAQMIAKIQNKDLNYELIDNHSSRPGHDLRYSLDPSLLRSLGWEPKIKLSKRIEEVVNWSLKNKHWLTQN
jgi:dTDP-glucose 4,6-dehydratase